ncbi:TraM recognition domain-containing protein [Vibrio tubiashii]|uniref:type IV secretory system conjugative DNA transfer family protein n=1 Tax=Vibrio tubiashii TaxID=29498 RepID=UPI001EFC838A|nr:TraM recognition domain-containing protein [Vibrio tubiashii]MCG9579572.1 TraM recognition domain-containing protein [Vibrio tubiashii]
MSSNFAKRTRFAMQTGALDQRSDFVDDRPLTSLVTDYMPMMISAVFFVVGLIVIFFPSYSNFIFLLGLPLFLYGISVQMDYLISAPYAKDRKKKKFKRGDSSEKHRSGFLLKKGDAFMLLGYDLLFGRQIWIDIDRETRMELISGTTGSGKTVTLNAKLFQSCIQGHLRGGAPVFLGDGKGSVDGLYDFLFYIVRTGRINCVRILNFLTGGASHNPDAMLDEHYPSNKFNIFSDTNPDESRGIVMGFGKTSEGGSNDYFRDRASNMLAGAFPPLCYLRDNCGENLDITVLQQNLGLRDMIKLASRDDIPAPITKPLREYLKTLNMINDAYFASSSSEIEINQKADEQHTYNKSMVSKTVNEMAGTFGHIFSSVGSDINTRNVIKHGQILLVLLPTIEKEPDSMAELGRMFLSSLRPAFASLFGYKTQGLRSEVTNQSERMVPVRVFLDEVLNYYQRGLSQFLSLMRDRKVSLTLLGQSMKGMEDAGLSEAAQSKANLNNKLMFGSQDVAETYDYLNKNIGTMRVKRVAEQNLSMFGNWHSGDRLTESEEAILSERDIASAEAMEGLYVYKGTPIPFKSATFFPDDERDGRLDRFYLNHYAELQFPTQAHIDHVKAILGLEASINRNEHQGIDPATQYNGLTTAFVEKVESACSAIRSIDKTDVYRSFDALVFALIDDIVSVDLEAVAREETRLTQEAEQERGEMLASRGIDEVMEANNSDFMVVDAESVYGSHSDYYGDELGLSNYDIPSYDEDEQYASNDESQVQSNAETADNDNGANEASDESSPTVAPNKKGIGWLNSSRIAETQMSAPSYGALIDDDSEINTSSKNEEENEDVKTSPINPLHNQSTKRIVEDAAAVTSLTAEEIGRELLDVKVYPAHQTPPKLPEEEHDGLTENVRTEMDDADSRLRDEVESRQADLLDSFLPS